MSADTSAEIRKRYLQSSTSCVADVLHAQGLRQQVLASGIRAVGRAEVTLAGWAYTLQGESRPWTGTADAPKSAAVSGVKEGNVVVWDGGSVEGVCLFGDLLAEAMVARGCAGAVVDGGIRDTAEIERMGFPVFARYRSPCPSTNHWMLTGCQIPVSLPGAVTATVGVMPGDFIMGDRDGVVVVPATVVERVIDDAEALMRTEADTRRLLREGADVGAVLRRFGRI